MQTFFFKIRETLAAVLIMIPLDGLIFSFLVGNLITLVDVLRCLCDEVNPIRSVRSCRKSFEKTHFQIDFRHISKTDVNKKKRIQNKLGNIVKY